jgi:general secretion pathway protein A
MYLTFFGFREKPFNLTPDPKFLYLNASYREALAALRYGINERKGFVSLIGEAGTGKTTLLRRLLAELGSDIRSVLILNPAVDFDELLVFILTDLGHSPAPGTPKLQLLQALNAELLDTLARGGNVVVLIDEAQDLSIPVLEELRLLSNLETAKEKILQFVLAGQPELDGMLARPELRQLRQRIAVPARLRPLGKGEVAAYVAARISAAGGDARGIFAPSALRQLYQFSRGVPRLVNVACDSALVTAYAAGTRLVDGKLMREAIRDLRRGPYRVSVIARWRTRLATVAIAGLVGAAMGLGASRLAGGPLAHWRGGETGTPAGEATPHEVPRQVSPGSAPAGAAEPQAAPSAGPEQAAARATDVPQGAEAVPTPALATAALAIEVSATPAPPEGVPAAVGEGAVAEPRRVYVQAGDDLTHIARRNYGYVTQELLNEIQRANPGLTNLDLVNTGQTIVLPPGPEGAPEPAQMPQGGAAAGAEPERAVAPR